MPKRKQKRAMRIVRIARYLSFLSYTGFVLILPNLLIAVLYTAVCYEFARHNSTSLLLYRHHW